MTFPLSESKSAQLFERARHTMPGGNTRHMITFGPYIIYADRGEGCRLWDVDGNQYIDWVNNFSSHIHGHASPEIISALSEQLKGLMSCILPAEAELELAELLVDRFEGLEQVRFNNSGTEAVMVAIKAARAYTGRSKIMKTEGGYHGQYDLVETSFLAARAYTGRSKIMKTEGGYHGQYDLVETSFLPTPETWGDESCPSVLPFAKGTPQSLLDEVVVVQFNKTEATRELIREHADELAAVIIDPIPARLGFTRASKEYLEMLREETRRYGIVLIFDEVFCTRAGYNGAQGEIGVIPDLTTLGKIIGGGLPVGAVGGNREVMSVFDNLAGPLKVSHSGTFTANSMTMVAGLTAMRMLTPEVFEKLAGQGKRLRDGLNREMEAAGFIGRANGEASMSSIQLFQQPANTYRDFVHQSGPGYLQRMLRLHRHMLNQGVLMATRGLMVGSTAMSDADIDETIEKSGQAFRSYVEEDGYL